MTDPSAVADPSTFQLKMDTFNVGMAALIGAGGGFFGGLLGMGGSVIIIPALAVLFSSAGTGAQHLFQAAAMAVNVAVSVPAALRHHKAGVVHPELLRKALPVAIVAVVIGVLASNHIPGESLRRVFTAFLVYTAARNIKKLFGKDTEPPLEKARLNWFRSGSVGGVLGGSAGLLGIGGGAIAVPFAQNMCRLPLRYCIGVGSAMTCLSSTLGATLKVGSIQQHGFTYEQALTLAGAMAPTAWAGSRFGAAMTHRLPLRIVRGALVAVLLAAAWKMWG